MLFALDKDDGTLVAFRSAAEAVASCKAVDVQDGYWRLFADDGSPLEAGTIRISASVKPLPTIDTLPAAGTERLGVYDIVGDAMRLNLGAPGAARPASLDGAAVYSTR